MHFTWEMSAGQVVLAVPLGYLVIFSFRVWSMLLKFRIEHEILMLDWAMRQEPPVKLHDMPTRGKKWW